MSDVLRIYLALTTDENNNVKSNTQSVTVEDKRKSQRTSTPQVVRYCIVSLPKEAQAEELQKVVENRNLLLAQKYSQQRENWVILIVGGLKSSLKH